MESTRFDALIRVLASAPSRRAVGRGILALALGGAAGIPCLGNPDCLSNACIGFRCQ